MSSSTEHESGLLLEVRRRRAELRASMSALEHALASPAGSGGSAGWNVRLRGALGALYDDVGVHVAITEGPDGLYRELARYSPRLERGVDRLVEEHADIVRRLEELVTWADANDIAPDVAQARRAGTELLVLLMRHRQRDADLVFEAYQLDIGGET